MGKDDHNDWIVSNLQSGLTRRRVLTGSATVVGGGTALLLAGGQTARAEGSVEDVDIADAAFEAEAVDPIVDVDVAYAFRYDAPTEIHIELQIGGETVADELLRTASTELENTTDLSGRVVDSPAWSLSDFEAPSGETITRTVEVGVRFSVIDGDSVVAGDTATDTAEIVVEYPTDGVASVGMVGEIRNAE